MTPIYNQYIKPNRNNDYVSEIAVVNTNTTIIKNDLFYLKFNDNSKFSDGYYLDNNKYLMNLYINKLINKRINSDIISNIDKYAKYYCYIKVLRDYKNPQLEGKIMLFSFGEKIFNIFQNNNLIFDKTFKIICQNTFGFGYLSYEKCFFTDNYINIVDNNLDINSELNFKKFDLLSIERKEKLKYIQEINENNDFSEWICE